MKNILYILIIFMALFANIAMAEDAILHETFQVEPDFELMIGHEFYKGIKIRGVNVKQIEVSKDTLIKDGKIIEGEPNYVSVVVELTDMKGKKIELYGARPIELGDYQYIIRDERIEK